MTIADTSDKDDQWLRNTDVVRNNSVVDKKNAIKYYKIFFR